MTKPIWNDLLSSQPLCFNLFAPLQADLELATGVFRELLPARVERVTAIRFEHSPGRGDPRYTGDRSAFDAFIEVASPRGRRGFIGVEVKYHEDLSDSPSPHRERYEEIATAAGIFREEARQRLRERPLQQLHRDHLLAESMVQAGDYEEGAFAVLAPAVNPRVADAVGMYQECLARDGNFLYWKLEDLVERVAAETTEDWIDGFRSRYLDFERAERLFAGDAR